VHLEIAWTPLLALRAVSTRNGLPSLRNQHEADFRIPVQVVRVEMPIPVVRETGDR
jgi:hypothetical protein